MTTERQWIRTDADELRRLAEAATPGPWHYSDVYASVTCETPQDIDHNLYRGFSELVYEGRYLLCESVAHQPTRRYIAAMHPQTTLALLDRLATLEDKIARMDEMRRISQERGDD